MTVQQNQIAWTRLVARYGMPTCPVCQHTEWQVHETVMLPVLPRPEDQKKRRPPWQRTQQWSSLKVPIVCLECGYDLLFDFTVLYTKG